MSTKRKAPPVIAKPVPPEDPVGEVLRGAARILRVKAQALCEKADAFDKHASGISSQHLSLEADQEIRNMAARACRCQCC